MKADRQAVRIYHKQLRDTMTSEETEEKSAHICRHILKSDWYRNCGTLYAYYPMGNEADCRTIILHALDNGKTVALPRTLADNRMEFYRITSLNELTEGKFHVMEPPDGSLLLQVQAAHVLVPGVVFDRRGNRYGYGGGYYDRYFARFPGLRRIALGYENQLEDEIEAVETDIKMDCLSTESGIYLFGNREEGT